MKTDIIRVYGIVQGVGFRPFVSRVCIENGIKGTVSNKGSYVEIHAQGDTAPLFDALRHYPPERSVILSLINTREDEESYPSFEIIESEKDEGDIFISPDIGICQKCKEELFDPENRRYLHPFINCTNCGPRLTILDLMPYDRERTSMSIFPMCKKCEYEYTHPETRRYDAQPVCCNECGPKVYIIGTDLTGRAAVTAARKAICDGKIIAVKGIGGFHLCCDGTNEKAVRRLRELKHREMKPFAVMMKNTDTILRECADVSEEQLELLTGYQKPVVLLRKSDNNTLLAPSVAPDNPTVGAMLPYAPVQLLLFDHDDEYNVPDILVMTSGNVSGAPICRDDNDAVSEISEYCDLILSNDRLIRIRCDDTVTDMYKNKPYMIRRSRGFAPVPIMLTHEKKGCVIGIGGELKNTFCIAKDSLLYPSAYVGDMADIRTVKALEGSLQRMTALLEAKPSLVVCDMHPKYNTVTIAESLGLPVVKIQHHYAHILSCMAENDHHDEVLGISLDGTGYGTDGTVWGSELLLCRTDGFERLSHITPFIQTGGDISAKEGWRIAASVLRDFSSDGMKLAAKLGLCSEQEYDLQAKMAERMLNSVISTSAGRVFDAVSALLDIRKRSTFEGEAATSLMFAAQRGAVKHKIYTYNRPLLDNEHLADTNSLICDIAERFAQGEDNESLAYMFHAVLADMITAQCEIYSEKTGIRTVALSGGVFQNTLLLGMCEERLENEGIKVLRHSMIPPNDGGISVGQAFYGLEYLKNKS